MVRDPVMSPRQSWRADLERTSEALNSSKSRPSSLATNVAVVVSENCAGTVSERSWHDHDNQTVIQRRSIIAPSRFNLLPIPGGPDKSAAFQGPWGAAKLLPIA